MPPFAQEVSIIRKPVVLLDKGLLWLVTGIGTFHRVVTAEIPPNT
jgi:hypothetical protein